MSLATYEKKKFVWSTELLQEFLSGEKTRVLSPMIT